MGTTLVYQCPHCLADRSTFDIHGQSAIKDRITTRHRKFVFIRCRECGMPSVVEITSSSVAATTFEDLHNQQTSLAQLGYTVVEIWPKPPRPHIPDHLPDEVARAYLAAERNFPLKDMEEAAAGSYGRALDLGTKLLVPGFKGMLNARIEELASQNKITPDLAAWAHEIRLIRNYAMHELDGTTRAELIAIRGFTEMVLSYLFTLPAMLTARKADAGTSGGNTSAPQT